MAIFIKQEPQLPLLPVFSLVMPERHPHPTRYSHFFWNDVKDAYPPPLYDPETRTFQPQRYLSHGTQKLGALLVNYKGVDCILIFGITYWESTPWCQVVESRPVAKYDVYLQEEDFFMDGERIHYYHRNRSRIHSQGSDLRHAYENFDVINVTLPTDLNRRKHRCVCESLGLVSIVEHITISGRGMYILRLLKLSEEPDENGA